MFIDKRTTFLMTKETLKTFNSLISYSSSKWANFPIIVTLKNKNKNKKWLQKYFIHNQTLLKFETHRSMYAK